MNLYRGITETMLREDNGDLKAKGTEYLLTFTADSTHIYAGNDYITVAPSKQTAAHLHNYCSDTYKTSYISCTTDLDIARKFATYNGFLDGYIFELSIPNDIYETVKVDDHNLSSTNPDEHEILINLYDFDLKVPKNWIIKKTLIKVK